MNILTKVFCCLLSALSLQLSASYAQSPVTYNSSDIYMQLKKLNVLGSVLYVAAHPDDENNGFLPWLAKEKLYRTAYLSLTRGDGGQNLIGSEQGIELGLIRTQELLAARRIDGAEQYFSRAYEFGFSKSADEALRIWNREKVLSDVVWMIRKFQPDVIITRFPGDARAGHGHHAASSILAQEAYTAAADPKKFPEQFQYGVKPWLAKRIVWNTFNFGGTNTTSNDQLKAEVNGYNALLGKSYGELGGEARTMHKSQGEGRPRRRGSVFEFFQPLGGETAKNDLMEGVVTDWKRIDEPGNPDVLDHKNSSNEGQSIQDAVNKIISNYNFDKPELSVDALVEVYKQIQRMAYRGVWWKQKLNEVQELIIACSGLFMEATTDNEYAVKGEKMNINFFVNKRSNADIQLESVALNSAEINSFDSSVNVKPAFNQNISFNKTFLVPNTKTVSQPYWLVNPQDGIGMFTVNDQNLIGHAESEASYSARFTFSAKGISFRVVKPLQYKFVDPVKGELYHPLVVISPLIVSLSPDVVLTNVRNGNTLIDGPKLFIQYKSNFTAPQIPVTIHLKQEDSVMYAKDTIIDFQAGQVYNLSVPVKKSFNPGLDEFISARINLIVNNSQVSFSHYLRSIKYDHIPDIHYFYKDNVHVVTDEIKVTGKKIGYIIGAGDKVPEALEQMGFDVKIVGESDLVDEKLKQFDAIIVGIRAYNIYEYLTNKNDVLSKYVENGGNLILQYLKSNQVGLKRVKAGPYTFIVNGGSRVTEEVAKVNFLLPQHPILNYPNKITQKDFEGWIQERSTYQAEQLDPHFEAPLSMHDTGEKESNGSLVTAKYGKGNITYVSLVLFRELPAGVPGAYRLLANIIALSKK